MQTSDSGRQEPEESIAAGNTLSKKRGADTSTFQFVDNQPEANATRRMQALANNSTQVSQLRAFQDMANNNPQAKHAVQLQFKTAPIQRMLPPINERNRNNITGVEPLPQVPPNLQDEATAYDTIMRILNARLVGRGRPQGRGGAPPRPANHPGAGQDG